VLLSSFYGVGAALAPLFIICVALSNFAGPVVLGRFFDSVGRKPMIAMAYLGSALVTLPLAGVFLSEIGGLAAFMVLRVITFFLAPSGARAAYLTGRQLFPRETRAHAPALLQP